MYDMELIISSTLNVLLKESCHMVLLPSINGEIGILKNHVPTVVSLDFGLIKLLSSDNKINSSFYIDGGMAQINRSSVHVVCNYMKDSSVVGKDYVLNRISLLSDKLKLDFYNKILKTL